MAKFFPIKTATACQLKWTWSSIYLYNGTTNSCHRVQTSRLNTETFMDFHNTPKKLSDREAMLNGQWPDKDCEYCKKIEDAGGISDRLFHLNIPDMYPPELDNNAELTTVTPKIVEVYFDNTCNLACVYCNSLYSSKIQQENNKFGRYDSEGLVIENSHTKHEQFNELTEQFWLWMDKNYTSIKRLQVLGGEPFYQTQFDRCLDFLQNNTNKDLEFNIVSNLMLTTDRLQNYIEKIKSLLVTRKIGRLDLTASIDCWGPEQEYVRYGLNLEQWKKNFEYLANQKWITLNINQVVSVLTIPSMVPLINYINEIRKQRYVGHYIIKSTIPSFLDPDILGSFYEPYFKQILDAMPEQTWQQREIKEYMNGIRLQIVNNPVDPTELHKLKLYLNEIDRRRNLNWKMTFPWLQKALDVVR
jgi:pyruvate-formate lyase-activating enzyme